MRHTFATRNLTKTFNFQGAMDSQSSSSPNQGEVEYFLGRICNIFIWEYAIFVCLKVCQNCVQGFPPWTKCFLNLIFQMSATRCFCPLRASPSQRRIVNNRFRSEFQYKVGGCNNLVVHGDVGVVGGVDSYSFDSALGSQPKNKCVDWPFHNSTFWLSASCFHFRGETLGAHFDFEFFISIF